MSAPTRTTPPAKKRRGEGQWALGHLEPLNPNERTKRDDDGLNVRRRIETIYAQRGFDSIDPADLRGRQVEGFQVHPGGVLGLDSGFGRKLRGHKVTSTELGPYVERLVRNAVQHHADERFAQWVTRADENALR